MKATTKPPHVRIGPWIVGVMTMRPHVKVSMLMIVNRETDTMAIASIGRPRRRPWGTHLGLTTTLTTKHGRRMKMWSVKWGAK
jgi:hypothetical protein